MVLQYSVEILIIYNVFSGRGFGRGPYPNNNMEFPRGGRGFYQHGQHGQTSRMGYTEDYPPAGAHPSFRGRHDFRQGY